MSGPKKCVDDPFKPFLKTISPGQADSLVQIQSPEVSPEASEKESGSADGSNIDDTDPSKITHDEDSTEKQAPLSSHSSKLLIPGQTFSHSAACTSPGINVAGQTSEGSQMPLLVPLHQGINCVAG